MKFTKIFAALAITAAVITLNIGHVFAADLAAVSLSTAGGAKDIGSNFTVTIRENSGTTNINLVTAILSYDAAKLQFVGFDDSSSEFDYKGAQSGGAGSVSVKRGLYGGAYTGSHTVVGVTFKAIAGSGSASIAIADGTRVTDPTTAQNVWDGAKPAIAVALATPAPASNPSPEPTTAPTTPGPANSNNSTKKTATTSNSNNTTTTPSAAPEAEVPAGEVKSESDKKDGKKKDDKKADETADTSEKSNIWTGILVAIAAGFAFFAGRRYVAQRAANAKAKAAATEQPKKHNKKSNK